MLETITTFQKYITEWTELQGFIDKTKEKKGQFPVAVIQKLVAELEVKQSVVFDKITPMVADLQNALQHNKSELAQIKRSNASYEEVEQELNLRKEIGLLDAQTYQSELQKLQSSMTDYVGTVQKFESTIQGIEEVLLRWEILHPSTNSVQPKSTVSSKPVVPTPVVATPVVETPIAKPTSPIIPEIIDEELPPIPVFEPDNDDIDDLPPVLYLDSPSGMDEFGGREDSFNPLDGESLNFELSENDLGFDDSEYSADLIGPDDFSASIELNQMDVHPVKSAFLIRDEGSVKEAVFPFQGELYTIGRNADNDIQIKGDNKVSRHHCELNRRGSDFFVKDLGSSNGTMINGEVFQGEKRLIGGEELKVGETVFKFMIQE